VAKGLVEKVEGLVREFFSAACNLYDKNAPIQSSVSRE